MNTDDASRNSWLCLNVVVVVVVGVARVEFVVSAIVVVVRLSDCSSVDYLFVVVLFVAVLSVVVLFVVAVVL